MMTYDLKKLSEIDKIASQRLFNLNTIAFEFLPEITNVGLDDKEKLFESVFPLADFLSTTTNYPYLTYHIFLLAFVLEKNKTPQ
jgi:hypothetical protein